MAAWTTGRYSWVWTQGGTGLLRCCHLPATCPTGTEWAGIPARVTVHSASVMAVWACELDCVSSLRYLQGLQGQLLGILEPKEPVGLPQGTMQGQLKDQSPGRCRSKAWYGELLGLMSLYSGKQKFQPQAGDQAASSLARLTPTSSRLQHWGWPPPLPFAVWGNS